MTGKENAEYASLRYEMILMKIGFVVNLPYFIEQGETFSIKEKQKVKWMLFQERVCWYFTRVIETHSYIQIMIDP